MVHIFGQSDNVDVASFINNKNIKCKTEAIISVIKIKERTVLTQ